LIDPRVLEQLIRVPIDAGYSGRAIAFPSAGRVGKKPCASVKIRM
jgi:hypothetical protein